eukprot:jgi/Mesvir1/29524/Mv07019-RA.1
MKRTKWQAISKLDAFPRTEEHLTQKTSSGALVTIFGVVLIVTLFVTELSAYLTTTAKHEMSVDLTRGETLPIYINITFPSLPCIVLSLDALDMSGKHEVDITSNIYKVHLDRNGVAMTWSVEEVGDSVKHDHGDENDAAAHMRQHLQMHGDTVRKIERALAAAEGCRVHGHLDVERVAGNFHISVHSQSFYVLQQVFPNVNLVNVTHYIHSVSFGPEFPGIHNPLDGYHRVVTREQTGGTFKYFLKVVPTTYVSLSGSVIPTNQYSVTEFFTPTKASTLLGGGSLPAVYFLYDLSPITVSIKETRQPFRHFLTRICAVVGGSFAVMGMFDKWVHRLITYVTKPRPAAVLKK